MEFNQDLSLNQIVSILIYICNVKEFLYENLIKKITIVMCIYNLSLSTLQSSIDRTHKSKTEYNKNNRILLDYKKNIIY